jgi:hypothetical protein
MDDSSYPSKNAPVASPGSVRMSTCSSTPSRLANSTVLSKVSKNADPRYDDGVLIAPLGGCAFPITGKAAYSIPAYSDRQPGSSRNTAEGSATSTARNWLRRRAPTLTHVRQQAS